MFCQSWFNSYYYSFPQELVKRYSEFINFPIYIWASKEVDVEVPADEDESSDEEESCMYTWRTQLSDLFIYILCFRCVLTFLHSCIFSYILLPFLPYFTPWTAESSSSEEESEEDTDKSEDEEKKPKSKTKKETTYEWELLNDVKAIWLRNPKEVTDEEYTKFYHSLAKVIFVIIYEILKGNYCDTHITLKFVNIHKVVGLCFCLGF